MNKRISDPNSTTDCYESALRILGLRGHSSRQLRTKLLRRGYDGEVVDATMSRLVVSGLLNESQFAEQFVRSKLRRRNGSVRIARELEEAGVSRETTKLAIAKALEDEPEEEYLRAACDKRIGVLLRRNGIDWLQSEIGRNKLIGHLLQQGYETAAVLRTVTERVKQAATGLDSAGD